MCSHIKNITRADTVTQQMHPLNVLPFPSLMNFMLTTTDEMICMKRPPGLVESLLSCHLYNIVIRATAAVLCTVMSVRLGQSCPQQAGGWIVEMGEETGCGGAGVRCRESP